MDASVQQIIGGQRAAELGSGSQQRDGALGYADAGDRRQLLTRAVERDILPHLVLPRRSGTDRWSGMGPAGMPAPPVIATIVSATLVEEFAGLVLEQDFSRAFAFAETARGRGMTIEGLCLELLAPAARHLGDLWNEDLCDFTQVTIGLGKLHRLLREISPAFPISVTDVAEQRRALLVPSPGEQHTFGLAMVTEFFRQSSWVVWSGVPAPGAELAELVRQNWFGIIGFSVGSEQRLDALRTGIRSVRRASRNPAIGIMVGGPVFIEHPEWVAQIGADGTACDGRRRSRGHRACWHTRLTAFEFGLACVEEQETGLCREARSGGLRRCSRRSRPRRNLSETSMPRRRRRSSPPHPIWR